MFISKLRISGFKSFSEDTTITINNGLNGIIGPNGSGKSNIVEAIKWVMGENSTKSLRGSGLNDLIYSGSASKASKNIALVSLTIEVDKKLVEDNYKKFLKDNIILVERQVTRDSGSTYRINGKEVKAKEVQFLFADFSSGSKSSNIIDQGSVGNLVLQKPLERRKILDEAAGISGISARKNETNNKLEATKRNLQRLNDILVSKRRNLADLQKQARKASFFREAQKKVKNLKEQLSIAKWKKTKNQLSHLETRLSEIEVNLKNNKDQLEKLNNLAINKEKKISEIEKRKKDINEKNLILNLDIEKINFEINSKKNDLVSLKNLKIQINKSINFQDEILQNSKVRLKELDKEINILADLDTETQSEKQAKKKVDFFLSKIMNVEEEIRKLTINFNNEKYSVSKLEFEKPVLKKRIDEISNTIRSIKNNISEKLDYIEKDLELEKLTKIIRSNKKVAEQLLSKKNIIFKNIESKKNDIYELNILAEKESLQLEEYKNIVNDIEKEIFNYLSLGYKTTESNILQEIKIQKDYRLAFCLAIGDGIEADNNENSDVKWLNLKSNTELELPEGLEPLSRYVKGPQKLHKFLSQVAVVKDNLEGYKFQKILKNGQIAVTKEGSLWRWDGLVIINGKKTLTYKRIESTTKILELEKCLLKENKELLKRKNKKTINDKAFEKYNKELMNLEDSLSDVNNKNEKIQTLLNSADKNLFVLKSQRNNLNDEVKALQDKLLLNEKNLTISNQNFKKISFDITKNSSKVIAISRSIAEKKIILEKFKQEIDKWQINYALEKQKNDTLLLKKNKNLEEIKETNKKTTIIQETVTTLKKDLKDAEEKIILIELNPSHSNNKIELLKKNISNNNANLNILNSDFNEIEEYYNKTKNNISNKTTKIDELKEKSIRTDAQIKEILNFLETEEANIKNELNINLNDPKYLDAKKYSINIKEAELDLKKIKFKADEYDNINFSAEKDAFDLGEEVDKLSSEEKDLTRAAKKLERAVEELNKESRSRIVSAFKEINNTFSLLFKKLFSGGKAYLELVDSSDPLEAGLEMMVSPPGKKLQKLSLLSGGEKALASLALIFSTFINKESPICILDEVDAPLDEGNVEKFCELLKEATKVSNKRFLVVTHNKITMGYMNKLYGITMLEPGSSKVVSVNLDDAESVYAAE